MSLTPSPTQSDILIALRSFLLQVLPSGDAIFNGSISGQTLTVTAVAQGTINIGDAVIGEGVVPHQIVVAYGTGSGGTGTYTLSATQTLASTRMWTGVEVIQSQDNRVPEPIVPDFVTMTPIRYQRLETNIDGYQDVSFTAAILGNTLTVTAVEFGTIGFGQIVFGVGVSALTRIIALGTGTGGVGTYSLSSAQTVSSRPMASGSGNVMQPVMSSVQLDVYGPNSGDNAQTISTLFRDRFAVDAFAASGYDVTPLFVSDPRQLPYSNENQQVENRWVIDAQMQANQAVSGIPQQFADQLVVTVTDVQAAYPVD
jgi:hypothetical protein